MVIKGWFLKFYDIRVAKPYQKLKKPAFYERPIYGK